MPSSFASPPIAVVPLRDGKTRLSGSLDHAARHSLTEAMLRDVAGALREAGLTKIRIAAADAPSEQLARDLDLEVRPDPIDCRGLDQAILAATSDLDDQADVLVVMADLPAVTSDDIQRVLAAPGPVVIAPTADGGTGALLRRPGNFIRTAYGLESAVLHAARVIDQGVLPTILDLAGFQIDIDTEVDLRSAAGMQTLGQATSRWIAQRSALASH